MMGMSSAGLRRAQVVYPVPLPLPRRHVAAARGHVDTLVVLLRCSASPNESNAQGMTPLHAASREGQSQAVAALVNGGALVDAAGPRRATPLHLASRGALLVCDWPALPRSTHPLAVGYVGRCRVVRPPSRGLLCSCNWHRCRQLGPS